MKAKEYFNEWKEEQPFGKLSQTFNKGYVLNEQTLFDFAEAYRKAEVEAISDEDIEKEAWQRYGEVTGGIYHADRPYNRKCFINGAKWFKQQLPKQ